MASRAGRVSDIGGRVSEGIKSRNRVTVTDDGALSDTKAKGVQETKRFGFDLEMGPRKVQRHVSVIKRFPYVEK